MKQLILLIALLIANDHAQAEVDFVSEIQPIFRDHCYECHGGETREAGLRLDQRDAALAGGDSGRVIQPNDPDGSLLIKLVSGEDADRVMPPDGENLTANEIETLKAWIADGAIWPDGVDPEPARPTHWAYQPIATPTPPTVKHEKLVHNEIDRFVLKRLEEKNIEPSAEANRETLIRRLSLDLLGLPPEPEAVHRFVNDDSADAYENLVDELLLSPHFGERWGRHWLDKARYADSDGYEKDRPRYNAWKYRDWVIDAINADMPFDQFTIEQLAGDLLPNPTSDQLLATAFNRQTLTNTEGGTDKEEFRVEAVFDRIETIGTVWMGLTVGCARCHSHKYDDISQREYYELFAFFNNADEVNTKVASSVDAMDKYNQQKQEFDQKLAQLRVPLNKAKESLRPGFAAWQAEAQAELEKLKAGSETTIIDGNAQVVSEAGAKFEQLEDGSYLVSGPLGATDTYAIDFDVDRISASTEQPLTGIQLELLTDSSLPKKGPGRATNGNLVLSEITLDRVVDGGTTRVPFQYATADHSQKEYDVAQAIDGEEGVKGWAISPQMGKNHTAKFFLTEPIATFAENEALQIRLSQLHGIDGAAPHCIGRFRVSLITGYPADSLTLPEEIQKILAVADDKRNQKQKDALFDYYAHLDNNVQQLQAKVDAFAKKAPFHPIMDVRILRERTRDPRPTKVLKRGDFLQPLGDVSAGTLDVLPSIEPRDEGSIDRLDLAHWLVSPTNPLTSRLFANDVWSRLFGAGLVRTVNDFGVRGDAPTHPELLDWLARHAMENGWSRKHLIKTILMSRTYRQSSAHRPELQDVDPLNLLLARQNRYRVEAEIVRDLYLAASGLLDPRVGGPSVFPEIPAGIAEISYANNFKWGSSDWNSRPDKPHGVAPKDDIYRRGLYTFFKRTAPHPNLITFDCPDANVSCVERDSSNTPLQALQTLNNDVFVTASRELAEKILQNDSLDNPEKQLTRLFERCLGRSPSLDELKALSQLQVDATAYYATNADEAEKLVGRKMPPQEQTSAATAGWITVARVVMNLDEFITRE